ncbi:MAG: Holliday junction branch migration protein RuvA [Phycisphaerales bacterium]
MLTRLTGILESADDSLTITVGPFAIRAEAPRYLLERLAESDQIGQEVTLHTRTDLESHNQGTSFTPRLIAFANPDERRFFEIFTSVKGLGAKRALRALAKDPAHIAAAIVAKDAKALQQLPEIGKRLAETVIAELSGKVDRFATELAMQDMSPTGRAASTIEPSRLPPAAEEAVAALLALGETRADAERKVEIAMGKAGLNADTNQLVRAIFGT